MTSASRDDGSVHDQGEGVCYCRIRVRAASTFLRMYVKQTNLPSSQVASRSPIRYDMPPHNQYAQTPPYTLILHSLSPPHYLFSPSTL